MEQIHNLNRGFHDCLQAQLFYCFCLESNVFSGIFFRGQSLKQTKRQKYDPGDSICRKFCCIQGAAWVCKGNF